LEIPNYSLDVLLAVLRYIYVGVVDYRNEIAPDVSKAAKEFDIRELVIISNIINEQGYYNPDMYDLKRRQNLLLKDLSWAFEDSNSEREDTFRLFDITIRGNNEPPIYAHKVILSSRSEQLKKHILNTEDDELKFSVSLTKKKISKPFF